MAVVAQKPDPDPRPVPAEETVYQDTSFVEETYIPGRGFMLYTKCPTSPMPAIGERIWWRGTQYEVTGLERSSSRPGRWWGAQVRVLHRPGEETT